MSSLAASTASPQPAQPSPISLALSNLTIRFGGLVAVSNVSLQIPTGSIYGLIGPNGAGKTTVFNMVTGVYRPTSGTVHLFGADITGEKPAAIAGRGIARTFQNIRLFSQFSVIENVLVACEMTRRAHLWSSLVQTPLFFEDERDMRARAMKLLKVFDLDGAADADATSLSYGNQRRLEIARAMMLNPKLLLLDEPAAGLNYGEAQGLQKQIQWLRDEFQLTVVLVEHNMQVVMGVCERIHVLDRGETIAEGTAAEVQEHPRVLAAYLGEPEPTA